MLQRLSLQVTNSLETDDQEKGRMKRMLQSPDVEPIVKGRACFQSVEHGNNVSMRHRMVGEGGNPSEILARDGRGFQNKSPEKRERRIDDCVTQSDDRLKRRRERRGENGIGEEMDRSSVANLDQETPAIRALLSCSGRRSLHASTNTRIRRNSSLETRKQDIVRMLNETGSKVQARRNGRGEKMKSG